MRGPRLTQSTRAGVLSLCLIGTLNGCASMQSLLPQQRVVIACPDNLRYRSTLPLPPIPRPLTNLGLREYAESLLDYLAAERKANNEAAEDCRAWLVLQGYKP